MEPDPLIVSLKIAPKSKNYETYETEGDSEFISFKKSFENSISSLDTLSLQGNSYSKVFCEQFSSHLKNASKLKVHLNKKIFFHLTYNNLSM